MEGISGEVTFGIRRSGKDVGWTLKKKRAKVLRCKQGQHDHQSTDNEEEFTVQAGGP